MQTPPIVLLHGFLGAPGDWDEAAQFLQKKPLQFSLPNSVAELGNLTKKLPPFDLVGYSMGGRMALQFAAKYPERVRKLVLISAHLGLASEEEKKKRLESDTKLAEMLMQDFEKFLAMWYDQSLFASLKRKRDIVEERKHADPEIAAKMLVSMSLGKQDYFWNRIPSNASFILGELDEKYRVLYANLPHRIIRNAGHAVHLEEPQATAQAIQEILR